MPSEGAVFVRSDVLLSWGISASDNVSANILVDSSQCHLLALVLFLPSRAK